MKKYTITFCYNGKELDRMHGLRLYDYGARQYDPAHGLFTSIDPLCEKYYHVSPYMYCEGNPVNMVDPDGRSTWVVALGDGKYRIVGGDLNDNDRHIYAGHYNENGLFVRKKSIGISTSITSFYNADNSSWAKESIIDTQDLSGDKFLTNIIEHTPPLYSYMEKARNGQIYDFKYTNANIPSRGKRPKDNGKLINYYYRGMPIGVNAKNETIFSSARDIGNIAAGYVAAINGIGWPAARMAFDLYQGGVEPVSTQKAHYYGWKIGYNNVSMFRQARNLLNSLFSIINPKYR